MQMMANDADLDMVAKKKFYTLGLQGVRVLIFILSFFLFNLHAQRVTISGYVRDAESGETLIGANIYDPQKQVGTSTNGYGFYSLTITADSAHLIFSYVGYEPHKVLLPLQQDTVIQVHLRNVLLGEVIVSAERTEKIQESSRMGTFDIPLYQIKKMPAMMGEADVIKVLQLLPGVHGGSEGSSGLYVRGGGPDQNLILLDGVPVYNASHLYGFFSTFNADAINHVELVKGGFPARYGGRLSSVVDISMKEGNSNKFHGKLSLGLVASKMEVEGPIKKERTSFIVSARRSNLNLLKSSLFNQSDVGIANNYFFYDLNAKINHKINDRNRIYVSFYKGADKAGSETIASYSDINFNSISKSNSGIIWGNEISAFRWNHIFSKKLFANFTTTYSRYNFRVLNETSNSTNSPATGIRESKSYKYDYRSGIRDYAASFDLDFIPNPRHYFRFGLHAIKHLFTPGVLALTSDDEVTTGWSTSRNVYANELSAYAEDDWEITSRMKLNVGAHASTFLVDDTSYPSIQPRISARYLVTPAWSFKASYTTMQQNIHLLTNAGIGLPTDLWVPATGLVRPQTSKQGAIGFAYNLMDEYEISLEGYYKTMHNLIEYKDGASYLSAAQDWQTKIETGSGESYGAELFLQKKLGKVNGWLGYTLAWNNRQFPNLNQGRTFPYRYDRRHDAKIAISYLLSDRINLGLVWVYGTGNVVTIPLEKYDADYYSFPFGSGVWHYESRNNFRMRAYHRLDLNASYSIPRKWGEHRFTLSVYNAYARKNPFYLQLGHYKNESALIQVSLFSILPSLTYSIEF